MKFKALKNLAYLTQVAFLMLTPILGGVYIGNFIDTKLNSSPWILLLCIVLGVGTAFLSLFKFVMTVTKDQTNIEDDDYIPNSKEHHDE